MNDFRIFSPDTMYYAPLCEAMDRYKDNQVEVPAMCDELEKWCKEERNEGYAQGRKKTILAMLKHGMPTDTIAQIVGWTNEKVRELGKVHGIL